VLQGSFYSAPPGSSQFAFLTTSGSGLIKSFAGVQGVVFQKNPLAAGGKKKYLMLDNLFAGVYNRPQFIMIMKTIVHLKFK
jgi:hypothetical protein